MGGARPDRGEFALLLRRLRESASLTQEELAERAGLTSNAIGALERGERRRPYPHTVRALSDALTADDDVRAELVAAARPGLPTVAESPVRAVSASPVDPIDHSLIGREVEVADLLDVLRAGPARLITVTGPGRVGKTRLALAVAETLAVEQRGPLAVAELAPVRDARLVLPTAARALGLRQGETDDLLERLATFLGGRRQLLVLDNVEHLVAAAPQIAELLGRCSGLLILATSRAPLRIRAEQDYPLAPRALPSTSDLAAVASSPAVRMFLDRAQSVAPSFALTASTSHAVEAICRRLDGLPLALELAAAHARFLNPNDLLNRLDQAVVQPRARDLPERQATIRATLDWSHALLTADEQALLRRLSVFSGGFTLDAVDAVAGDDVDAFAALGGLVEQSLVTPTGVSGAYRMLEPVRQYASAHLAASGDASAVAASHAAYYRDLGSSARLGLRGPDQRNWLNRLHSEHGNLRAALATFVERGDADAAGELLADTWLYWAVRGMAGEGLDWAERILMAPAASHAVVHVALAGLRYATGNMAGTTSAAAAAVTDLEQEDDLSRLAEALVLHGSGAAFVGDFDAASRLLESALGVGRRAGDRWATAHALIAQGLLLLSADDYSPGVAALTEAETVARALASPFTLATLLNVQASLALLSGDDDLALDRLEEAAQLAADVRTAWTLVYTLPNLAVVAARRGLWELATTLFAAGAATADTASLAVAFAPDREIADEQLANAKSRLDHEAFRRAWDEGRELRAVDVPGYAAEIRRRSAPA